VTALAFGVAVPGFALALSLSVVVLRWRVRDRRRRLERLRDRRIADQEEDRRLAYLLGSEVL